MNNFKYIAAKTVAEVITLLNNGHSAKILGGGTDLIPQLKQGLDVDVIIDIKNIEEVKSMRFSNEEGQYIGAAVSCLEACRDPAIRNNYPGLVDAFSLIGGIQIQGRASIGGNLCNASPAADSIPALMVHNAVCLIAGQQGRREVMVKDFCTNPGQTVMQKGEFLVGIRMPAPQQGFGASYQRFIPRNEMDIAVVGVGASVLIDDNRKISRVQLGLGAVAPRPLSADEAADELVGKSIDDPELEIYLENIGTKAKSLASPITDMRGSAKQRKHLISVLVKRELSHALQRAKITLEGLT